MTKIAALYKRSLILEAGSDAKQPEVLDEIYEDVRRMQKTGKRITKCVAYLNENYG